MERPSANSGMKSESLDFPLWASCDLDGECHFFDTLEELKAEFGESSNEIRRARRVPASEWIRPFMGSRDDVSERITEIVGEDLEFIVSMSGSCIEDMPPDKYTAMVADVESVMARHLDPYVKAWELEPKRGAQ